MNKADFIKAVAEKGEFSQKSVRAMLNTIEEVAYDLVTTDDVPLIAGLTLSTKVQEARTARNPRTGEAVSVPEKRVPKVKIGKAFKTAVAY